MLIDFHTHVFPDKIAPRAMESLAKQANIPYYADGTLSGLKKEMARTHTDISVILPVATTEHHTVSVNAYAAECGKSDGIVAFGSVFPFSADAADIVAGFKQAGLAGVKLHPEYQNFYADDRRVFPLYAACEELGLPVVFHAGIDLGFSRADVKGRPRAIAYVAKAFPRLTVIAAHGGGFLLFDEVEEYLSGLKNVYIDTAFLKGYVTPERLYSVVAKIGTDRVLFATDCPWSTVTREMELIESLPLTAEDKDSVFYKNAEQILKI